MIQLGKNNVKYKGRTDYTVEFATIEDKQYFVKEKLNNGSFIATTNLKEAINEEMNPVSYGVIDSEGQVIIPFDKRNIRSIDDKYLIVELSNPVSQDVVDMAALKNDPLATSKLVTIRADLKEKVNTKMAEDEGRFEFNDPCSEATIFDYNGNNLVNNENYSYIGKGNNGFYLLKLGDDSVYKLDLVTNEISNLDQKVDTSVSTMDANGVAELPTVGEDEEVVPTETPVEEVIASEEVAPTEAPVEEVTASEEVAPAEAPVEEVATSEEVASTEAPVEEATASEEVAPAEAPVEEVATSEEVAPAEAPVEEATASEEVAPVEAPVEEIVPITEEKTEDLVSEDIINPDTIANELTENVDEEDNLDIASVDIDKEALENEINDSTIEENDAKDKFDNEFELNLGDYNFENNKSFHKSTENLYDYDIEDTKSKYEYNDVEDEYTHDSYNNDSVIPSAIKTIDNLFRQNKLQKDQIDQLGEANEHLEGKIINYKEIIEKYENKIQALETDNHKMQDKIHDQNDIMEKQDRKIISLREAQAKQMEQQKRDEASLVNLLHEIRPALNHNNDYEDDYEYSYRRMA